MLIVAWGLAILISIMVMVVVMGLIVGVGSIIQINVPEWIVVIVAFILSMFVISPRLTHWFFDLVNRRVSPKWRLSFQNKPIPSEYLTYKYGQATDKRWEKGWRLWLIYAIVAIFCVYMVFFYKSEL